jgi:hypothetical protein
LTSDFWAENAEKSLALAAKPLFSACYGGLLYFGFSKTGGKRKATH